MAGGSLARRPLSRILPTSYTRLLSSTTRWRRFRKCRLAAIAQRATQSLLLTVCVRAPRLQALSLLGLLHETRFPCGRSCSNTLPSAETVEVQDRGPPRQCSGFVQLGSELKVVALNGHDAALPLTRSCHHVQGFRDPGLAIQLIMLQRARRLGPLAASWCKCK